MNQLVILAALLAMQMHGVAAECTKTVGQECVPEGDDRDKACWQTQVVAGVEFSIFLKCNGRSDKGGFGKIMAAEWCQCVQKGEKVKKAVGTTEVKEVACGSDNSAAQFLPTACVKTPKGKYVRCRAFEGVKETNEPPAQLVKA